MRFLSLLLIYDPVAAARIAAKLGLKGVNFGQSLDSQYVMFRLRNRKFHPEVGVATNGWIYGVGYDFTPDYSLDIFQRKDFNLQGKPTFGAGVSVRFK